MTPENDILKKIDRHSGMTVPDGYFADFSTRMMQRLPEKKATVVLQRTWWQKVRPYAYMAAMFCGIWLMMWIFNDVSRNASPHMVDNPVIAEALQSDNFYDYYIDDDLDEYDLVEELYDNGVTLTNFQL